MIGKRTVAVAALATKVVIIVERRVKTRMRTKRGKVFKPNISLPTRAERPES